MDMSSSNTDTNVVARLIAIGKSGEFERRSSMFSPAEQSWHPKLASSHEEWLAVIESLDTDDLIALMNVSL